MGDHLTFYTDTNITIHAPIVQGNSHIRKLHKLGMVIGSIIITVLETIFYHDYFMRYVIAQLNIL